MPGVDWPLTPGSSQVELIAASHLWRRWPRFLSSSLLLLLLYSVPIGNNYHFILLSLSRCLSLIFSLFTSQLHLSCAGCSTKPGVPSFCV